LNALVEQEEYAPETLRRFEVSRQASLMNIKITLIAFITTELYQFQAIKR